MSTINVILEADADGTLHLPLPAELRGSRLRVTATVEPVAETARPDAAEMTRRRAAAMEAFHRLRRQNPYFEIADPVAWQREIREDRPLPFRDA